ncbi:T9SS C-terminal target domain-containing protein [Echinicola pacifica]|nr:T9SS C-terminal target domain-containing protein [Echinicola pacifica]
MSKFRIAFFIFLMMAGTVLIGYALNPNNTLHFVFLSGSESEFAASASFDYDQTVACAQAPILFTNTSVGDDLTYLWNFGDPNSNSANSSTEPNPSHTFIGSAGVDQETFVVSLTATDMEGNSDTYTQEITLTQAPSLILTSEQNGTTFDDLEYIITCESEDSEFTFINNSTTKDSNTSYTLDWGDGSPSFTGTDWEELNHSYAMGVYNLVYTVTGPNGCPATKEFGVFVGSNPAVGLANPGNTNVCGGQTLSFPITGTENNPEGTMYVVSYSDGSPEETYNHPPPLEVTHTFIESSCGINSGSFPNSYSVSITAVNPCSASSAVVSPIYVSEIPDPEFTAPEDPVCVESPVNIVNTTIFGGEVSNNGQCTDLGKFTWEITPETGWELQTGDLGNPFTPDNPNTWLNGSDVIVPVFSEPGTYTIRLITGNRCGINEEVKTICVTEIPQPDFELSQAAGCGPLPIALTNTSIVDTSCGEDPVYTWSVAYQGNFCGNSSNWEFTDGSNQNSENPFMLFTNPGIYTINLQLRTSCGIFTTEEQLEVYAEPSVVINPISNICEPTTLIPTANVQSCSPMEASYLWTFEGADIASSTSLDPGEINFDSPGEKVISLEVSSTCGITTETIRFFYYPPPVIDAGEVSTVCLGDESVLQASLPDEGDYQIRWTSSTSSPISDATTSSPTVRPLSTTLYTLFVTDLNTGCSSQDTVSVIVKPAPQIIFSGENQTICSGETSELITISSDAEVTLSWSSSAGEVTGAAGTGTTTIPTQTLINLTNAPIEVTYTAIITDSNLLVCDLQPAIYTITVLPGITFEDVDMTICNGDLIDIVPQGHSAEYSYTWELLSSGNLEGATSSNIAQSSFTQNLLNPGNSLSQAIYEIRPIYQNCILPPFTVSVTVRPSAILSVDLPSQTICSGNSSEEVRFSSSVAGGSFTWEATSNGDVTGLISAGNTSSIPSQTLINTSQSPIEVIYTIYSENPSLGECPVPTASHTLIINPEITVTADLSDYAGFAISCDGGLDGQITISPSGGSGNYTVLWEGPDNFQSSSLNLDNIGPGDYTLSITDEYGCSFSATYQLAAPPPIELSLAGTVGLVCKGESTGAITLDATGGNPNIPFVFQWFLEGSPYPSTAQNPTNLPAGSYEVQVSKGNNCFISLESIVLTEPEEELVIGYQKTDLSCYNANDGSLQLEITGGVGPYVIAWDFGSSLTEFTDLSAGTYGLSVTDAIGCIKYEEIIIENAPAFEINPEITQISCFGEQNGSIQLNLLQGGQGYTIRWDHGPEVESLNNLAAGIYSVTIEEAGGCTLREEFSIVEPALLSLEPQVSDALDCNNPQSGAINLGISGGRPPYTISWSNGATGQSLQDLPAGQYAAEVTDASGCQVLAQMEVKRPEAIQVTSVRTIEVSCMPTVVTEKIELFLSGGLPPYSVSWSGGELSPDGLSIQTTDSGLYTAVVTDSQGCSLSSSFTISNPQTIIDLEVTSDQLVEYNSHMVNFDIQFTSLSSGDIVAYFWDFGDGSSSTEANATHAYQSPGTYQVQLNLTDRYGCQTSRQTQVLVTDHYLAMPNAFSPNGDGLNDFYFPKFILVEKLEFWVLNKWGETVFYTNDISSPGWDGMSNASPALTGNYVYKLNYTTLDGRQKTLSDVFILLR